MNNYEDKLSNDTVLLAGLVLIAIAWVVLAAIRGPEGAGADTSADTSADYRADRTAVRAAAVRVPVNATARTVTLPASAQRSDSRKVS